MGTEKANGTKVPEYILQGWAREDRQIAEAMAAMMKNEESGPFPSLNRKRTNINFGTIMIFGTGGEIHDENTVKMFNNPEGYNIIEE